MKKVRVGERLNNKNIIFVGKMLMCYINKFERRIILFLPFSDLYIKTV